MRVVMVDKQSGGALKMPDSEDQQSVEAFRPNRSNEPLRDSIRLGYLNRYPNDSDPFGLEHGIKVICELSIVVADQKSDCVSMLGECPCDVPRLLHHPFAVGMSRAAGQVHAAASGERFDSREATCNPHRKRLTRLPQQRSNEFASGQ
jgi:hypothetical protein